MSLDDKLIKIEDKLSEKDKEYILNELERERRKKVICELYSLAFKQDNIIQNIFGCKGIEKSLGALSLISEVLFSDLIQSIYNNSHENIPVSELGTWGSLAIIDKDFLFKLCRIYLSEDTRAYSKLYGNEIYLTILQIKDNNDIIKYYEKTINSKLINDTETGSLFNNLLEIINSKDTIKEQLMYIDDLFINMKNINTREYSYQYILTFFHKMIIYDFDLFVDILRERITQNKNALFFGNYKFYDPILTESLAICILDTVTKENILPINKKYKFFYYYLDSYLILDEFKQGKNVSDILKELSMIINNKTELDYEALNIIIQRYHVKTFDELIECSAIQSQYQIVSILGKGSSGIIYKVYSLELKQYFALKIINDKFNPKEAELMARLKKGDLENIVQIYDAGKHIVKMNGEERYAIVMEYIDGNNLGDIMPLIKGSLDKVLQLGAQLLNGIECLRNYGIIHRDLNLKNIKVSRYEYIKILDFGIATDEINVQQIDARRYGSPRDKDADDLFSLGLLLFEMYHGYHLVLPKSSDMSSSTHANKVAEYKQRLLNEDGSINLNYSHLLHEGIGSLVRLCLEDGDLVKIQNKFIQLNPIVRCYFMSRTELINQYIHDRILLYGTRPELKELDEKFEADDLLSDKKNLE